jgi:DNA polymerase-3 subunit delta'
MSAASSATRRSVWPIYGHEWAVHLLQRTLAPQAAGPRHAYLFLGPPQVGKSTLARTFAQALLCSDAQGRPCGVCRACGLMARGVHPDFRLVQPLDKPLDKEGVADRVNGMLRGEQAAELIHEAALRPVEAQRKVFVIQDAHTATPTFANKLLKTLEEPPDHVILLVTAHDRGSVLPTIVSRCQVLELRPLPVPVIEQALIDGWQVEVGEAALLARLANGRLGWAVAQLGDREGAGRRQAQLEQLWKLVAANQVERLDFAEHLAAGRNNQQLFAMLELWAGWWRDVLLAQAGCLDACCNVDQQPVLARQAAALAPTVVRGYLYTLQRLDGYLHHTVNTRLALDILVLRLPHTAAA